MSDGSLDASFDGDGRLTTDFGGTADFGMALDIDAAQQIVVAGYSYPSGTGNRDFALVRYNADGTRDATFSGDGRVTLDFVSGSDYAVGVRSDADGNIVVAGYSLQPDTREDFALARFTNTGDLDAAFGVAGRVLTDVGGSSDYAQDMTVDVDGKILVVGYATDSGGDTSDFALVRYNPNGTLDTAFSGDGIVQANLGSDLEQGHSIRVVSDEKIVVAGDSSQPSTGSDFAVVRFHGTLPAPWVLEHAPVGQLYGPVSQVVVTFSEPMAAGSFSLAADVTNLQGPAGAVAVTGHQWLAADRLQLTFPPQTVAGPDQLFGRSPGSGSGGPGDEPGPGRDGGRGSRGPLHGHVHGASFPAARVGARSDGNHGGAGQHTAARVRPAHEPRQLRACRRRGQLHRSQRSGDGERLGLAG